MIDNRQHFVHWSPERGSALCDCIRSAGAFIWRACRLPADKPETLIGDTASVSEYSVGKEGAIAYAMATTGDLPELYWRSGGASQQLTNLNGEVLAGKTIAETEAFTFVSNDNKFEVEALSDQASRANCDHKHP